MEPRKSSLFWGARVKFSQFFLAFLGHTSEISQPNTEKWVLCPKNHYLTIFESGESISGGLNTQFVQEMAKFFD